jgi:hypothetical protein
MKHTILLTPSAVPNFCGRQLLEAYLDANLPTFMSGTEVLESEPLTHAMINAKFEGTSSEVETIELVINPFNRVFLYYLVEQHLLVNPTAEEVAAVASKEEFASIVLNAEGDMSDKLFTNISEVRDQAVVTYKVRVDTLAQDLSAIPGLSVGEDVFDSNSPLCNNMYRDYYTDEVKAVVAQKLAGDIAVYGYTF